MHKLVFQLAIATILVFDASIAIAFDCSSCGTKGLPALSMYCPFCKTPLYSTTDQLKKNSTAILSIDVFYTGDSPERLPEYGKIYINGIYRGNIPRIECERRDKSIYTENFKGVGFDYTARYHVILNKLQAGTAKVEVEMKFKRMFGLARSFKRVCFPYVSLKAGEETKVCHKFSCKSDFSLQKTAPATMSQALELRPQIGTFAIEVPFFE